MLMIPEGDSSRRRHAHTECVIAARKGGRLPTRDEWRQTQPRPKSWLRSLLERIGIAREDG
jgi:hypothetical protein